MLHTSSFGQTWQQLIYDEVNYDEAVRKVDAYFSTHAKGRGSGYKQYMRWKEEMSYHVDAQGTMINSQALNYKAYQRASSLARQQRTAHGQWADLGPFDYWVGDVYSGGGIGRINCTAFHPTDDQIMWIGTPAGGLWKTTDGGVTWSPMTDGFASIGVSGIAVHPENPDILYALTGDGDGRNSPSIGVMKTTNGGHTWEQTGLAWGTNQLIYGYKLVMHPDGPDTLFAVMQNGIWRSGDAGDNWTQVYSGWTTDIEFKPDNPAFVYAATINQIDSAWWQSRFYKSTDHGNNWTEDPDTDFPDTSFRSAIAVSPSQPTTVYMVFGGGTGVNGTFRGFCKSTNSGTDFTFQSNTPNILDGTLSGNTGGDQSGYDLSIIVDPEDDTRVFVGGVNMWKSENSGLTWSRETWWTRNYHPTDPYVHADWHNMYFKGNTLVANVDGGFYTSDDYGNSWTEWTAGMSTMQFYEIDILNTSYIGGTQDNGTNGSDFSDPQANNLLGGDGFGAVWHTGDNSIQFLTTQNSVARRQFGSNVIIWEEENGFWYTDLKMHTTQPDYLFLSKGEELFRGNQDGFIWNFQWDSLKTNEHLFSGGIRGYVQGSGSFSEIMYVISRNKIMKTSNINVIPPVWDSFPDPVPGIGYMTDIMISPTDTNEVWVSCGGYTASNKMFYSSDGGASWTNITGSLPNTPVRCIAYQSGSQDGIYIGTDIGVFYKDSSMTDWIYFSTYFPNVPVNDIVVYDGYVYAGTFGRGIWRSPVYACPFNLVLTPANDPVDPLNIGYQEFNATNAIFSTRIIQGSQSDVLYSAGNYIDLTFGFWAKEGSNLQSVIGGCPD